MNATLISHAGDAMKPLPFVVTPDAYDRALNVVGEKITVLASKAATQGYEIFFQQGDEGTGPPPHSHDWDETFFVLGGSVEISYGDTTMAATRGALVHLPAGTLHSFRFGAGGGEMLSITSHGGNAASLFRTIDAEIAPGPPDVAKLLDIASRCGVHVEP